MFKLQIKKKWFTLAEVLIVCTVFAVMVVWMILAINRAFVFMDNIKLQVIATNFAREWVEMVYNIRDTNWRKFSGERDNMVFNQFVYRTTPWPQKLVVNTGGELRAVSIIKENDTGCDSFLNAIYDDVWIFFDFIDNNVDSSEKDVLLHDNNCGSVDKIPEYFTWSKLDFMWVYSYFSWGQLITWEINDLFNVGDAEFYRVVRVYWVYTKKDNATNYLGLCQYSDCDDSEPKEMRFCVKVFYRNGHWKHATELCSIMTNFMK